MVRYVILVVFLCLTSKVQTEEVTARRPVATYSIVARDADSGQLGVAVQSHWFSVGPIVPWAEAGVGAVATQSLVDPAYGPLGLDLMRMGRSAEEALKALLAGDSGANVRQVAMVDAEGNVAAHTGRAYLKLNEGDLHLETNDIEAAMAAYRTATEIVPDSATQGEAAFWVGVTLADLGRVDDAIPYLSRAYRQHKRWADLIPRLPASHPLPDDPDLIKRLVSSMKKE